MAQGKIKWFDPAKGYGFIEDEKENLVFLHHKDIDGSSKNLKSGQKVKFDKIKDGPNLRATNLKTIDL